MERGEESNVSTPPENDECPRCGTVISGASTDRLCPACLISQVLTLSGDRTPSANVAGSADPLSPADFPRDFGGYRLLRLLGRGGMGMVFEAEERATGRRLALKMLGQELDSPEMRQRFLREGRLAARVNHPNSLFIYGSEAIEGLPVITMEVARGGTLKDRLDERGPLPVTEAVDAILGVISGLESAYGGGVLHRDVKPSNCFVGPDGSVKVGDFGLSVSTLAQADSLVTTRGRIMGTPAYASPEQLRGDDLDVRADIYSVGATLYTLLTNRPPFEGDNAVQVVANAVNRDPTPLGEVRPDVPPRLEKVVARCLAKEPGGRYGDYRALRNALLPFSSREPEPASIVVRVAAGWIDYLVAFLPPYVTLMLLAGGEEFLVRPLVERTLHAARYHVSFLAMGILYFTLLEGIWGAGLGKWLKGLRVVRPSGGRPGLVRAFARILLQILCVELVRWPVTMALISSAEWSGLDTASYVITAVVCGWIPALLILTARRENGYATVWDLATGTRVRTTPRGTVRPSLEGFVEVEAPTNADSLGPYRITGEVVPGRWLVGTDPVLRRQVWLMRSGETELPRARTELARPGRQRWLQTVTTTDASWEAFEVTPGGPLAAHLGQGTPVPWSTLRHWLHDLASELWAAAGDRTLPARLSLDHVWLTSEGRAVLLDRPWPRVESPAEGFAVEDLAGQQRFLSAVAASVESTSVPLHARPVLQNLVQGRFEKLSFLTGTLRGLLDRPAEVTWGVRAGSLFLLPLYLWMAAFVGYFHDKEWTLKGVAVLTALLLVGAALVQLLEVPIRGTMSHSIFRLAVVDGTGEIATRWRLLRRWAIVWLPLLAPLSLPALLVGRDESVVLVAAFACLLAWGLAAAGAVVDPHRGLHDRLAGTWVVRR